MVIPTIKNVGTLWEHAVPMSIKVGANFSKLFPIQEQERAGVWQHNRVISGNFEHNWIKNAGLHI
jgi:hypothetical protein